LKAKNQLGKGPIGCSVKEQKDSMYPRVLRKRKVVNPEEIEAKSQVQQGYSPAADKLKEQDR
jgi:hypothetical protein